MDYPEIPKPALSGFKTRPNLDDLSMLGAGFDWKSLENSLGVNGSNGFNQTALCIDRHAASPGKDKTALIWVSKSGEAEKYSFGDLSALTGRFANALESLGVAKGDRVFTYMDRLPELYVAILGTLKLGAIAGPLFADFGPEPVRERLRDSGAKILVSTPALLTRISSILPELPDLKHIILVDRSGKGMELPGLVRYDEIIKNAPATFDGARTDSSDFSMMHYTSGTTGNPKGAVHNHYAAVQQFATGRWVLDLHDDDIYWCTADPGWVTGTSYGIFAPWSNGITQLVYQGGFGATAWYSIIEKYRVTVWYTAPTALRMLVKAGEEPVKKYDLSSLRHICSVGEPLNPEVVMWGMKAFRQPIHDNWWQTETGGMMVANYPLMPVRPGSMGRPIPGVKVCVVDENFNEMPPGKEGRLVIKRGWPGMFRGYWNNNGLYESRFKGDWYVTGDRARRDADGYFWFIGREDDVIKSAGHLIGPFEVESVLMQHPAVAEAGVIGKPDPIAMEVVKAFVSLKPGYEPTEELHREIMQFARRKLAAATAPRHIEFVTTLPKTRSGKIMRRLLKAKELGQPPGDTSTLEDY